MNKLFFLHAFVMHLFEYPFSFNDTYQHITVWWSCKYLQLLPVPTETQSPYQNNEKTTLEFTKLNVNQKNNGIEIILWTLHA